MSPVHVKLRAAAARLALTQRGEGDADVVRSSSNVNSSQEEPMTEPGWNLVKGKKRSANRKSSKEDEQLDELP
jgi:hypothetical protein